MDKKEVLFVCVHNAGRSQMAAGLMRELASDLVDVKAAGSEPAETLNPAVVAAMAEIGIDISQQVPRKLTFDDAKATDVAITMGCGDACPVFPGKTYLDWQLDDPAGKSIEDVRKIRDQIKNLVEELAEQIRSGKI
ncbi:MAG: arsenate reductase ArsC [Actinomycetota bacterium]|nr:arsenate reductase ArsC [Actinomycetota bacterium]